MTEPEAIFHLHTDLPREAPGSDGATLDALRRLPQLRSSAKVLDVGCGPGRSAIVLTKALNTPVIAIDIHEPYLARAKASAYEAGVGHLVITRQGRMEDMDEAPGTVDLIWAEGSIYLMGFANGLQQWRPMLRDGGLVVVTELTWLVEHPPPEAEAFWRKGYPAMANISGNMATATGAGYEVLAHFPLPRAASWDEYLAPLAARVNDLRPEASGNAALRRVLDETEREVELFRKFGDAFGYVFYLLRRAE